MIKINTLNQKKVIVIAGLSFVLLLIGLAVTTQFLPKNNSEKLEEQSKLLNLLGSKIDAVSADPISVNLRDDVSLDQEVSRMPKFVLALPDQKWFSSVVKQAIGLYLGFDDRSSVSSLGSRLTWTKDNNRVVIDNELGTIEYSSSMGNLPTVDPRPENFQRTVKEFFDKTGLPNSYLDLENIKFSYLQVPKSGETGLVSAESGPLLKGEIGYVVSGVPIYLPMTSFVVIDGDNKIRLLSVLIPNISQDEGDYNLIGLSQASKSLQNGYSVVIDRSTIETQSIDVDKVQVAYYLNQSNFYNLGVKRILTPVYIFNSEEGKAVVLATK